MRFTREFVDSLNARADIVALVGQDVADLKKKGADYWARSPFKDEKTPSFSVSPSRGTFKCWSSGEGGKPLDWLIKFRGLDFVTAVEELAKITGTPLPAAGKPAPDRFTPGQRKLLGAMQRTQDHWVRLLGASDTAKKYLEGRGFNSEAVERFGIGYAADSYVDVLHEVANSKDDVQALIGCGVLYTAQKGAVLDRFRNRITLPVRTAEGEVVGVTARYIGPPPKDESFTIPKYLNSSETEIFKKGNLLFGLYQTLQARSRPDSIVFVEGCFDVVRPHISGVNNVVAPLGTGLTAEQLKLALRYTKHLTFCFDGDEAGYKAALRAASLVAPLVDDQVSADFVILPAGHDPDTYVKDHGAAEFRNLLAAAQPLSRFVALEWAKGHNMGTPEGRSQYALEVMGVTKTMKPSLVLEGLLAEISQVAHLPVAALRGEAGRVESVDIEAGPHPAKVLAAYLVKDPRRNALIPSRVASDISDSDFLLLSKLSSLMRKDPSLTTDAAIAALPGKSMQDQAEALKQYTIPGSDIDQNQPFWGALKSAISKIALRKIDLAVDRASEAASQEGPAEAVTKIDRILECMSPDPYWNF